MIDELFAIQYTKKGEKFWYRTHRSKLKPEGTVSLFNTRENAEGKLEYLRAYKKVGKGGLY